MGKREERVEQVVCGCRRRNRRQGVGGSGKGWGVGE